MWTVKRNILLNPGPATTTDRVKFAQVVPDICPREKEFGELLSFISTELTRFVGDINQYVTVLFGGSGTAAVESVISSVIDETGTILIVNNGAYGERMCDIARTYGLDVIEYKSQLDDEIDLEHVEKIINGAERKITHLAVVHHETTTGLLNDIGAIGKLCRTYDIELIVDAMSSYAAIPINLHHMNISYLAASSNKNIQGMAGISFVIANKNKLEKVKNIKPKNVYLNLYHQYQFFKNHLQMRFTPPVQTFYALKQAILELQSEGVNNRYQRYSKSWRTLITGVHRLGLDLFIKNEKHHSKILTSIIEPDCPGYHFKDMHDYLYNKGFTIYPGKINEYGTFRIANIGDISYKDMQFFLEHLETYLVNSGCQEN